MPSVVPEAGCRTPRDDGPTGGKTRKNLAVVVSTMVATTQRDGETWYECEDCGLLFDDRDDARMHEADCDGEDPSYIQ